MLFSILSRSNDDLQLNLIRNMDKHKHILTLSQEEQLTLSSEEHFLHTTGCEKHNLTLFNMDC